MNYLLWKDCVPLRLLRLDNTIKVFTVAFFVIHLSYGTEK